MPTTPPPETRAAIDGKFLSIGGGRFLVKGAAYGTFAPDAAGRQFPAAAIVSDDFARMRDAGLNTVRTYTTPHPEVLDAAARRGLRLMIGLPWPQHVAFLDDPGLCRRVRGGVIAAVRALADHPAALLFALGNEIPAPVVRWHGQARVERFLRELYHDVKAAAPEALLTYVNYPPTEYLSLPFLDVCAFNVYLHAESDLRRYLARLQHVAGHRPLLLAEAGADSRRQGEDGQASTAAMQLRAAFSEGACGAVVFAWTDEWWRGGQPVDDWAFGLVDASAGHGDAAEILMQDRLVRGDGERSPQLRFGLVETPLLGERAPQQGEMANAAGMRQQVAAADRLGLARIARAQRGHGRVNVVVGRRAQGASSRARSGATRRLGGR